MQSQNTQSKIHSIICNHCKKNTPADNKICHYCGNDIERLLAETLDEYTKEEKQYSRRTWFGSIALIIVLGISVLIGFLYIRTNTSQLTNTQSQLSNLIDRTNTLASSTKLNTSSVPININNISQAIVRVLCRDTQSNNQRIGSGVLYRSQTGNTPLYVQTSKHIVQQNKRTNSECLIALYKEQNDPHSYRLYTVTEYDTEPSNIDLATLTPGVITGNARFGTTELLKQNAISTQNVPLCEDIKPGESITVLGYPDSGGPTLTITQGIVSGFDTFQGIQYIKTSAKIDTGGSGGLAVLKNGCRIGIPTFVRTGQAESIGRILDLQALKNSS